MSIMESKEKLTKAMLQAIDEDVHNCPEQEIVEAGWIPVANGYLGPIVVYPGGAHALFWMFPESRAFRAEIEASIQRDKMQDALLNIDGSHHLREI